MVGMEIVVVSFIILFGGSYGVGTVLLEKDSTDNID